MVILCCVFAPLKRVSGASRRPELPIHEREPIGVLRGRHDVKTTLEDEEGKEAVRLDSTSNLGRASQGSAGYGVD